jgi:hypothetical protein
MRSYEIVFSETGSTSTGIWELVLERQLTLLDRREQTPGVFRVGGRHQDLDLAETVEYEPVGSAQSFTPNGGRNSVRLEERAHLLFLDISLNGTQGDQLIVHHGQAQP